MMNRSKTQPAPTALHAVFFRIFLVLAILSLLASGSLFKLNQHIATVVGKVTDTFNEQVYSKKRSYSQECAVITYSINGKEHTGKTQLKGGGSAYHSRDFVPVYYYSAFPQFVWYYSKTNALFLISLLMLTAALIGTGTTGSELLKCKRAAALPNDKAPPRPKAAASVKKA
jgi:hypothetical protein